MMGLVVKVSHQLGNAGGCVAAAPQYAAPHILQENLGHKSERERGSF